MWLARRSGSSAEVNAIIVKLGISRKADGLGFARAGVVSREMTLCSIHGRTVAPRLTDKLKIWRT